MGCLVEFFVMVNTKDHWRAGSSSGAAELGLKESGCHAGEDRERRESMEIRYTHTAGESWDFGTVPCDWEKDGCVSEDAEVVGIMGVLPNVLAGEDQIFSGRLLQSDVEFIAPAGTQRGHAGCGTTQEWIQDSVAASDTGNDQIFVERCLEHTRVRNPKHGIGALDVISDAEARLGLLVGDQAVVEISTETEVERPVSLRDLVLKVKSELLYVGVAAESEQTSRTG